MPETPPYADSQQLCFFSPRKVATVMIFNNIILPFFEIYIKGNWVSYTHQLVHLLTVLFISSLFFLNFLLRYQLLREVY